MLTCAAGETARDTQNGLSAISVMLAIILAGCATLQNTPAQDYVWEHGRKCNAAGITMTSVDANGRYQLQGTNVTSFAVYTDCMKEQERREPYQTWLAARNKTSSQPQPVAVSPQPLAPTGQTRAEPQVKLAQPPPLRTVLAAPTSVPVQLVNNLVLVTATLNAKHGVTLVLDTGSDVTILTPETARRIGMTPGDNAPRRRLAILGGSEIELALVRLSAIQIGEARVDEIEVGVHDVAPKTPSVDGILGGDFLRRFTLTLDRDARQLRLEPEASTGK